MALCLFDAAAYPLLVGLAHALPSLNVLLPGSVHNADVVVVCVWVAAPLVVGLPHGASPSFAPPPPPPPNKRRV